jgi:hypothetical protein
MPMDRAIVVLAERHAAACRTDHGQLRFKPHVLRERLVQRADHHLRSPMQTFCFAPVWSMLEKPFVGNLSGSLAAALFDIEPRYSTDAVLAAAQRLKRLGQTETERAHNTGRDNGDSRVLYFYV